MGQLVHTLFEGKPVCGVTSLAGEIWLLRRKERDQVEVYDVITYRLQRRLTVPNLRGFNDMTSCEHYRCVYIGDDYGECVHRLDVQGAFTRWTVNGEPHDLSVNTSYNVLVLFLAVRKIKEFTSRGDLLLEVTLPDDVISPMYMIETRSGQFIVCHGWIDDPVHRVCVMLWDDVPGFSLSVHPCVFSVHLSCFRVVAACDAFRAVAACLRLRTCRAPTQTDTAWFFVSCSAVHCACPFGRQLCGRASVQ